MQNYKNPSHQIWERAIHYTSIPKGSKSYHLHRVTVKGSLQIYDSVNTQNDLTNIPLTSYLHRITKAPHPNKNAMTLVTSYNNFPTLVTPTIYTELQSNPPNNISNYTNQKKKTKFRHNKTQSVKSRHTSLVECTTSPYLYYATRNGGPHTRAHSATLTSHYTLHLQGSVVTLTRFQ
jgi:hypothetical protein